MNPSLTPTNHGQLSKPGAVLESAHHESPKLSLKVKRGIHSFIKLADSLGIAWIKTRSDGSILGFLDA